MRSIVFVLALGAALAAASRQNCHIQVKAGVDSRHEAAQRLAARDFTLNNANEDIHVCLGDGIHRLTEPVLVSAQHDHPGSGRVIWRPASGVPGAAIVTGGVPLTDWWHCDDGTHCPGQDWHLVYAHATTGLPNVTSNDLPFRQLWVNGDRAVRVARDPSTFGLTPTSTGFDATNLPAEAGQSWASSQAEFRWPSQIRNWIEPRCVVQSVSVGQSGGKGSITVEPGCWQELTKRNNGKTPPVPAWIENDGSEGPPGPGEFYSTPDYIFYRPPADAPYGPPTDAWAPILRELLVLNGTTSHTLFGLTFKHGTWRIPTQAGGYVPSQTLVTPAGEPQGAVRVLGSNNVAVQNCTFTNLGTAYALEVGQVTQTAAIGNCTFTDLSGGAVKLANVDDTRAVSNDTADWDSDYKLANNLVQEAALEWRGGAAVFAGYIANYTATSNTVINTGYTGFSTGWGWGSHVFGPQTFARRNVLTQNAVIDPMSALNDGGCFYTLGPSPNSVSAYNYCAGDRAPVVGGIYRDNGSRFWTVAHCVVDNTPAPVVYLQGCCNSPAYNISVSYIYGRNGAPIRNECHPQGCDVDNSTITYVPAGGAWPTAAQAIINAAGAHM